MNSQHDVDYFRSCFFCFKKVSKSSGIGWIGSLAARVEAPFPIGGDGVCHCVNNFRIAEISVDIMERLFAISPIKRSTGGKVESAGGGGEGDVDDGRMVFPEGWRNAKNSDQKEFMSSCFDGVPLPAISRSAIFCMQEEAMAFG